VKGAKILYEKVIGSFLRGAAPAIDKICGGGLHSAKFLLNLSRVCH
jgi:hypothetical protein